MAWCEHTTRYLVRASGGDVGAWPQPPVISQVLRWNPTVENAR